MAAAPSSVKWQAAMASSLQPTFLRRAPRPVDVEVGDGDDAQAGRGRRLRQEHGAELAGADDGDADRPLGFEAVGGEAGEVHGVWS